MLNSRRFPRKEKQLFRRSKSLAFSNARAFRLIKDFVYES